MIRDLIIVSSILILASYDFYRHLFAKDEEFYKSNYFLIEKKQDILNSQFIDSIQENLARITALEEKINELILPYFLLFINIARL